MTKSPKKPGRIFRLGLKIAVVSALSCAALLFLILLLFYNLTTGALTSILLVCFLSVLGIVYFSQHYLMHGRLEELNHITKNLSRKRFQEYNEIGRFRNDELDYLLLQTIRASKMVEKEIQRLNQIENYRKEFIGDISHELKTPIFAVQGFIETLLNGALEDPKVNKEFLRKAMKNVNRLIILTKDLMEISKLETGELKSNFDDFLISGILQDVMEGLNYKAQKEDITIQVEPYDLNTQVHADRNQIKQVLINLIENGIKYNRPKGKVVVSIEPYRSNPSKILVRVADTGIGIDDKDKERVTERFFRVDKSRSREKGGTGLGLSIVKHILEAHGEHLYIESKVNYGSAFAFTLKKITL